MKRKITVTGVNKVFFFFALLFMIFQLILISMTVKYGTNFIDEKTYSIILINEYVIILIPVLIYTIYNRLPIKETFRLNKIGLIPSVIIILAAFPAYMAALMFNNLVIYFLQFIGDIPQQPIPVPKDIPQLLVGIFVIAVSPAICEELLHRGLMLKAYEKRGTFKAIVITSIYFGIFHFDITNLLGPIFLGIIIGYYVVRTNSIFAGMLAHFMNNTIAELIYYFTAHQRKTGPVKISLEELQAIIIIGLIGLFFVWILMIFFNRATRGKFVIHPPISSVKKDIVSIASHWPIVSIIVLFITLAGLYIVSIASV
jgi:membrane protease YdiL (CAAX protease family)